MLGIAEKNPLSKSRQIVDYFTIGKTYSVSEIEEVLGYKPGGADRKGVLGGCSTDYIVLKITFEKAVNLNDDYQDHLVGSTLFWSSQRSRRFAERCVCDGQHDTFVFIRVTFGNDFLYYGRALPIRKWDSFTNGIPSNVVFDLVEYAESGWFKNSNEHFINYDKECFRNSSLKLWGNRGSVESISDESFLICRHIKPLNEALSNEANDPTNSLILSPNMDNLFSRGIISFSDTNGRIVLPSAVEKIKTLEKIGITSNIELNDIPSGTEYYLKYHKTYVFGFESCLNDWKYK